MTDPGTGWGGGRSGGTPQAVAYDRTQAFWSSQSAGQRSSPMRARESLIAACRSSASRISWRLLHITMVDGSLTPTQSNALAVPLTSSSAIIKTMIYIAYDTSDVHHHDSVEWRKIPS
jgi:hypothetical protein